MAIQRIVMTVGIQASGKSSWAIAEVAKDPENWVRISNDPLRAMLSGGVYSEANEKIIYSLRKVALKEALRNGKNVIIDNCNIHNKLFKDVIKVVESLKGEFEISEKLFYVPLNEAIARDSKREGFAKVGEEVIRDWWMRSQGEKFQKREARTITISNLDSGKNEIWKPMVQDEALKKCIVVDQDNSLFLMGNRSPYDASKCDEVDEPHGHVIECVHLYFKAGYKLIFVSGREEKDREPSVRCIKKYLHEIEYDLFMRPTGDQRNDVLIKEEIFNNHIKDKYFVSAWIDDRLGVCQFVFSRGLPLFRVNSPDSTF